MKISLKSTTDFDIKKYLILYDDCQQQHTLDCSLTRIFLFLLLILRRLLSDLKSTEKHKLQIGKFSVCFWRGKIHQTPFSSRLSKSSLIASLTIKEQGNINAWNYFNLIRSFS